MSFDWKKEFDVGGYEVQALKDENERLERKLVEAQAQLAHNMGSAFKALPNAADFMGSGVIVQITTIGGEEVIPPVMVHDGLSQQTVESLREDIRRSFDLSSINMPAA